MKKHQKIHLDYMRNANIFFPNGIIYGFDVDKLLLFKFLVVCIEHFPLFCSTFTYSHMQKMKRRRWNVWFDIWNTNYYYILLYACRQRTDRQTDLQVSCPQSTYIEYLISNENSTFKSSGRTRTWIKIKSQTFAKTIWNGNIILIIIRAMTWFGQIWIGWHL